jgi:hypothetical protein
VAWIRRVRTASGATAAQIVESVGGRRRIVAHVGSAHTAAELGLLLEHTRGLLEDPAQGQFDLGSSHPSGALSCLQGETVSIPRLDSGCLSAARVKPSEA